MTGKNEAQGPNDDLDPANEPTPYPSDAGNQPPAEDDHVDDDHDAEPDEEPEADETR